MTGRHGGLRSGAGRKPGPVLAPDPVLSLSERLMMLPGGEIGRRRRCALALAHFGATDDEIAAALALSTADTLEFLGLDITAGRALASMNVRAEILRAATGNGRPFNVSAAKHALRMLAPQPAGGAR